MEVARNKALLFAEDDPELLDIYTQWFKRLGYTVLCARNGPEAFSVCRTQHVDLVISDIRMAGGDGIELARQLRTNLDSSPLLVFLSGFADLSHEEAYDLGACAILNKPISRADLAKAVDRFLKPPHELWASSPDVQLEGLVEKRYGSLESALEQHALNFGRGGMFVRDCTSLPANVPVGFQFLFDWGKASGIDGCGIPRWQRMSAQKNLPAGVGIEILHFGAQGLDPVMEWISRANPRAFIPKE